MILWTSWWSVVSMAVVNVQVDMVGSCLLAMTKKMKNTRSYAR